MVVTYHSLRDGQTITVTRNGKFLGEGEIIERKEKHILLVKHRRGAKLTQRITLDGQEQYTLHP